MRFCKNSEAVLFFLLLRASASARQNPHHWPCIKQNINTTARSTVDNITWCGKWSKMMLEYLYLVYIFGSAYEFQTKNQWIISKIVQIFEQFSMWKLWKWRTLNFQEWIDWMRRKSFMLYIYIQCLTSSISCLPW